MYLARAEIGIISASSGLVRTLGHGLRLSDYNKFPSNIHSPSPPRNTPSSSSPSHPRDFPETAEDLCTSSARFLAAGRIRLLGRVTKKERLGNRCLSHLIQLLSGRADTRFHVT